jgi:hypothetical protein
MKAYGGVEVQIYTFLTFELEECKKLVSGFVRYTPSIYWTRGWMYLKTGVDAFKKTYFLLLSELYHDSLTVQPVG